MSAAEFRSSLISGMAKQDMTIIDTDGLSGDDLEIAKNDNVAMLQLIDFICDLHKTHLPTSTTSTVTKPRATKTKAKAATADNETPALGETKLNGKAKIPKDKDAPKRGASSFANFTGAVTHAVKDKGAEWGDMKVTVKFVNPKPGALKFLELENKEAETLLNMKDTEVKISDLLVACIALIETTGKKSNMSISSLMWSACGEVNPF